MEERFMKAFTMIAKILAAVATIAGIVYLVATYGDKIVAWAKKMLGSCCCDGCDCECDGECTCEGDCECCEEADEEAPVEEAPVEGEPVAEEHDFEA
jgi:hypothetical protein